METADKDHVVYGWACTGVQHHTWLMVSYSVRSIHYSPNMTFPRDDSGVRRTFPNLLKGENDTSLGLVRVSKILVGYEVSLRIRFAESLKTQVRNMVSQAQSESNGGLRIFGFQFGPDQASGTSFTRDVNSIKYNETTNEISLPASPRGCPVILGILGRKLGFELQQSLGMCTWTSSSVCRSISESADLIFFPRLI